MIPGIVYAICVLGWAAYGYRYIHAVASQDRSVPDPVSVGLQMREQQASVVPTSVSMWLKHARALGRRQADEDLEGLRRVALVWLGLMLLAFVWLVVS